MMDEELHRVLLFLMDTLSKFPGWTHQGMLKQELYTAQLDGTLHRILGSSPIETFTEFLKCFPTIFCINNSQLVQLSVKNGNISDPPGLPLVDGVGLGPNMKPPDDCGGIHGTNVLPVGTRKLPDPHLDWSPAPLPIVPESTKIGFLGRESSQQPLQPNHTPMPGTLCGIPASYPVSAAALNQRGNVGGWDPVGHSLPDLRQSFLGSDVHRGRSLGHLTNGWDRSARTSAIPNCQSRYPESAGGIGDSSSRLALNQQRYTWEGTSHSITDSLKNFSLSDAVNYQGAGANVTCTTGTTVEAGHNRWLPYSPLSGNSIDDFPSNGSGNGPFLRPLGSMWDDPMQSTTSPSQAPPPPPQQSFLHCGTNDTGLSSHNTFQWEDSMPTPATVSDNPSPLGFSSFGLGSSSKQQYYEWKSPSPALVKEPVTYPSNNETPLHEERSVETASPETMEQPTLVAAISLTKVEPQPNLPLTPITILADEITAEPCPAAGPSTMGLNVLSDMTTSIAPPVTPPAVSSIPPTVALNKGATLSYAEALRSNTQRRKAASDNASTSGCASSPYQVQTLPSSLKLSISNLGSTERQGKSRRSLDGRCGKVENLNAGDGTLRLGNGKVHFEKTIFYDSGKLVADLRNVLKPNDTVYFDAMLDGTGSHDWKATLAWVGKKPRSASASSPTTSNPVGRGYRSVENNQGCNATTNNGFPSRSSAPGSLLGGSKVGNREREPTSGTGEATVEGTGEVVILFAHFGFIRRGKKFKENVHFNRNVFYASGNRVKELTDVLKEGSTVNYVAVPSDKKSCKWKAVLVWTGARPKV